MSNDNFHPKVLSYMEILAVVLLKQSPPAAFRLITDLLAWYPQMTVLAAVGMAPEENRQEQLKIEGLAQISPRLKLTCLEGRGIFYHTWEQIQQAGSKPEIILFIDETGTISQNTLPDLTSQLKSNENLGALRLPMEAEMSYTAEDRLTAYRYAAFEQYVAQRNDTQIEHQSALNYLAGAGWQVSQPAAGLTNFSLLLVKRAIRALKQDINRLKRLAEIKIHLPSTLSLFLRKAGARSKNFAWAAVCLLVLGLGMSQKERLSSSLASLELIWPKNSRADFQPALKTEEATSQLQEVEETVVEPPLAPNEVAMASVREGQIPEKLIIPLIELDLKVKPVALEEGVWPVFDYVANYAEGTSLPNGISGNVGLFGHDRSQAFAAIKQLSEDNEILLYTADYVFIYRVVEVLTGVDPKKIDVYNATTTPQLTLVTCDGVFSKQRFVVKAELKRIERP